MRNPSTPEAAYSVMRDSRGIAVVETCQGIAKILLTVEEGPKHIKMPEEFAHELAYYLQVLNKQHRLAEMRKTVQYLEQPQDTVSEVGTYAVCEVVGEEHTLRASYGDFEYALDFLHRMQENAPNTVYKIAIIVPREEDRKTPTALQELAGKYTIANMDGVIEDEEQCSPVFEDESKALQAAQTTSIYEDHGICWPVQYVLEEPSEDDFPQPEEEPKLPQ